jgi:hypothetical protein
MLVAVALVPGRGLDVTRAKQSLQVTSLDFAGAKKLLKARSDFVRVEALRCLDVADDAHASYLDIPSEQLTVFLGHLVKDSDMRWREFVRHCDYLNQLGVVRPAVAIRRHLPKLGGRTPDVIRDCGFAWQLMPSPRVVCRIIARRVVTAARVHTIHGVGSPS